jgi:diguanylate cyclase (GGDEF)-like protein
VLQENLNREACVARRWDLKVVVLNERIYNSGGEAPRNVATYRTLQTHPYGQVGRLVKTLSQCRPVSEPPERRTKLLVVDDEPVIRQFLEVAVRDMGFDVQVAETLSDAIARCEAQAFDIVLVDKNLPDGSGLELCEKLATANADCKVALMTGYANLSSAVESMRHGVADYFVKPLDLTDLEARIRRMAHTLQLERQNRTLIQELRGKNRVLEGLSVRDPVTNLFNHGHFQDCISREVARSKQHGHQFALVTVALDRFSEVNSKLGHAAGDRVLHTIASLLGGDGGGGSGEFRLALEETAGRLGGDVFGLLLPETSKNSAAAKLQIFRHELQLVCERDPHLPIVTASIGIAEFPADGLDRETLLKSSDLAMAAAKSSGGDSLVSYADELRSSAQQNAAAAVLRLHALGRSLANQSFRFEYQPIVDVRNWQIAGYEALCRPTDDAFRHISELLDTTALAGRFWELGRILRTLSVGPLERLPPPALLFINLHPQDLSDPQLLETHTTVRRWASRIVFEITETEALSDYGAVRECIHVLRSQGFRIALDDLGSGYSGLNSLAMLAPDFVKLDMELIRGITPQSRPARLIQHIREFCLDEGIQTIAEGVETREELSVIQSLGVELVQGYFFAQPSAPFCEIARRPTPSLMPPGPPAP